ncbi:hypothetical protein EUTSA_v10029090mg [Eutrema salsugineum]|uniref:Uncharacterized protein n=1 Tax=Eutrema salsugineum TaxID=72664 RepID=V4N013_EUTSA|nr:hypothetical protein EUTSA_v10029090mg [Eutrema salsugineum]
MLEEDRVILYEDERRKQTVSLILDLILDEMKETVSLLLEDQRGETEIESLLLVFLREKTEAGTLLLQEKEEIQQLTSQSPINASAPSLTRINKSK